MVRGKNLNLTNLFGFLFLSAGQEEQNMKDLCGFQKICLIGNKLHIQIILLLI